ncbi:unnamed protein product [Cyclocybe aegerita]|uniref:Yeast cell wall synthesis Kre9/Knh1-like N-terminal domain-containing protein n=1 Tax=Cyclocybe aegerita TaxID=1973307 RepID=A0A8S0XSZ5_CYCAE|nr:unnamed protein product [Cyclocybe aegerita]
MFAAHAFTAFLALAAPLLARGDVTPSEPGPGDIFNAGSTCHIVWQGDTESDTIWKDMAIQLMTGSNLGMVHITTVATNQDGTVDGRFEYPCPEVDPYSAIYFYQFSSPQTAVKTWTTRFTIASPTGATTPPANATQPGSNDPIPWGIGNLVDPSTAVAAPVSGTGTPAGPGSASSTGTGAATPATSASLATTRVTTSSSTSSTASSTATAGTSTDGALSIAADARVWMSAAAIVFAGLVW